MYWELSCTAQRAMLRWRGRERDLGATSSVGNKQNMSRVGITQRPWPVHRCRIDSGRSVGRRDGGNSAGDTGNGAIKGSSDGRCGRSRCGSHDLVDTDVDRTKIIEDDPPEQDFNDVDGIRGEGLTIRLGKGSLS